MAYMRLMVGVMLKHIINCEPRLNDTESEDEEEEDDDDEDEDDNYNAFDDGESSFGKSGGRLPNGMQDRLANSMRNSKVDKRKKEKKRGKRNGSRHLDLLDFEGPKLYEGFKSWLIIYQILGQINLTRTPLYVSILFKLFVTGLVGYIVAFRFGYKFYNLRIINENYRNPIFSFITLLAFLSFICQVLVTLRTNMFDLCPLFKILSTPKLCFIKVEILKILGTNTISFVLIAHVYHSTLCCMMVSKSLNEFIGQFYLPTYLLDVYALMVLNQWLVGQAHADLYIRSAFGHWLLSLKSYLEFRFTQLHRHQRRLIRIRSVSPHSIDLGQQRSSRLPENPATAAQHLDDTSGSFNDWSTVRRGRGRRLINFDEIQKNLNNMDDHLEVLRSIQISSLALLSLNAFLGIGSLFLLTYHLLADQSNFYHGFLCLLISVNYMVIFFFCYSGDRWVYYALSSFVKTVEDEYFMQSYIKQPNQLPAQLSIPNTAGCSSAASSIERESNSSSAPTIEALPATPSGALDQLGQQQQMLLIKKKDVLFCHEFLHQFENHLATPWAKLTFKSNLHMSRAFVTLIAAQIIFDHEH